MTSFSIKKTKKMNDNVKRTLNDHHLATMASYENSQNSLPMLRNKVEYIESELNKLESVHAKNLSTQDMRYKSDLKKSLTSTHNEMSDIGSNFDELLYLYKTGDLLVDYYTITNHDAVSLESSTPYNDKAVIMYPQSKKKGKKTKRKMRIVQAPDIMTFFNNSSTAKIETLDSKAIMNDYILLSKNRSNKCKSTVRMCKQCTDKEMFLVRTDGIYVCDNCGTAEQVNIESDEPAYKSSVPNKPCYPYKRMNHLNEWLLQFQAKESTDIPKNVFDDVLDELNKNKIYNLEVLSKPELKLKFVKKILKRRGLERYYEHTTYIISKLNNITPPTIDRKTENKLRHMFNQIQKPFDKYKPSWRVNFLSYAYVLHKFCELLGLDELLYCFPYLKSDNKLADQDSIWKNICYDLSWEFIPSSRCTFC